MIEKSFLRIQGRWPEGMPSSLWGILHKSGRQFTGQHLTMRQIEEHNFLNKEVLERCHVFSVVRNPYDRARSLYNYWGGRDKWGTLRTFLLEVQALLNNQKRSRISAYHVMPQVDYLENSAGRIQMLVLQFERLHQDFEKCFHEKLPFNPNKHHNHVSMSAEEKKLIQEIYKVDFDNLSYKR